MKIQIAGMIEVLFPLLHRLRIMGSMDAGIKGKEPKDVFSHRDMSWVQG
jgi:hypothetical protein